VFGTRVRRSENYSKSTFPDPVATTVRFTQGALTYQDSREELHTTYDEQAYDDLPDKDTYIRALVAGGLVDIENREDVETFFRRQGYPDLDAGHQPVALGIDTNLLAWRMPDVLRLDPGDTVTTRTESSQWLCPRDGYLRGTQLALQPLRDASPRGCVRIRVRSAGQSAGWGES